MARDLDAERTAVDPSTPAATLWELSTHTHEYVRVALTMNQSTPADLLMKLSNDTSEYVREAVAENLSTPVDVLAKLSTDPYEDVRIRVAENRSIPADLLMKLSTDLSEDVRIRVAANRSTPAETLRELSTDASERVRRQITAYWTATPVDVLVSLGTDPNHDARMDAAVHPSTPAETLRELSTDPDYDVRAAVAANRSTPAETLRELSTDPDYDVRAHAAGNSSTPADVLATDNLNLACAIKVSDGWHICYSTALRLWVSFAARFNEPTPAALDSTWQALDRYHLDAHAPPLHELYFPTAEGWNQVDVPKLIQLLATYDLSRPMGTSRDHAALWDQVRQNPESVSALCTYTVGSTTMYLTDFTREWIQYSDGQWSIPDQWPAPVVGGWELFNGVSWQATDVFMVIDHLASRATPTVWEGRSPSVLPK